MKILIIFFCLLTFISCSQSTNPIEFKNDVSETTVIKFLNDSVYHLALKFDNSLYSGEFSDYYTGNFVTSNDTIYFYENYHSFLISLNEVKYGYDSLMHNDSVKIRCLFIPEFKFNREVTYIEDSIIYEFDSISKLGLYNGKEYPESNEIRVNRNLVETKLLTIINDDFKFNNLKMMLNKNQNSVVFIFYLYYTEVTNDYKIDDALPDKIEKDKRTFNVIWVPEE